MSYLLFKKENEKFEFVEIIDAGDINIARGIVIGKYGLNARKMYLVNEVNMCKVR